MFLKLDTLKLLKQILKVSCCFNLISFESLYVRLILYFVGTILINHLFLEMKWLLL